MKKNIIDGIKYSSELALVNLLDLTVDNFSSLDIFKVLKYNGINLPFISASFSKGKSYCSCCVSITDIYIVKKLINEAKLLQARTQFIEKVAIVSIFPHRSRLNILGRSIYVLEKERIKILSIASSISVLTFVIDSTKLEKAALILAETFNL